MIRSLWDDLDKITALLKNNRATILMLDFDGTLTPIVKPPQKALLSSRAKDILQKLSKKQGVFLAIISGRELKVLKERVQIPDIIYGGIHGLEGEIYSKKHSFPIQKQYFSILAEIKKELIKLASNFEGVLIQDKKLTLSLHYRAVNTTQISSLKMLFKQIIDKKKAAKLIAVIWGKKIWEIRPNTDCDKGYFAKLVIKEISHLTGSQPLAFYIGDDKTDEDAFKALADGVTIRVGKHNRSKAKYYLQDTNDVLKFLNFMYN